MRLTTSACDDDAVPTEEKGREGAKEGRAAREVKGGGGGDRKGFLGGYENASKRCKCEVVVRCEGKKKGRGPAKNKVERRKKKGVKGKERRQGEGGEGVSEERLIVRRHDWS